MIKKKTKKTIAQVTGGLTVAEANEGLTALAAGYKVAHYQPIGSALSYGDKNGNTPVRITFSSYINEPDHYREFKRIHDMSINKLLKETAKCKDEKVRQVMKWILKGRLEDNNKKRGKKKC